MSLPHELEVVPPLDPAAASYTLDAGAIARYLKPLATQSHDFDFFVGDWDCDVVVHAPDGSQQRLPGRWQVRAAHEGRMIVDDMTLSLPDGREVLGWVSLRTFCEATGWWEITGHRALGPATGTRTVARKVNGELHLRFDTPGPHHVRFFEITDAAFQWQWRQRLEGGWRPLVSLSARRRG